MPTPFLIMYFVGGFFFSCWVTAGHIITVGTLSELSLRRSCCCASVGIFLFRMWTEGCCGELKH